MDVSDLLSEGASPSDHRPFSLCLSFTCSGATTWNRASSFERAPVDQTEKFFIYQHGPGTTWTNLTMDPGVGFRFVDDNDQDDSKDWI
jgi:hypothetical protein